MGLKRIDIDKQLDLLKHFGITISSEIKYDAIKYLKSGLTIAFCPTVVKDEIDESKGIVCTNPTTQTDGEWTWSSILTYYLENYNISLPNEFVGHMQTNSWTVDKEKAKEKVGLPDLNEQISEETVNNSL